jgi:DNA-binding transcriptional LysR family regulator
MDLRKIEAFLSAAEQASLSEAAKLLHLSQPAVSHQIKTLEGELGVRLFTRTHNGLKLTEAGQMLLPWARKLLHETQDMKEMLGALEQVFHGHLHIACSASSGKYILPHLAARFCQRYPGVNVSVQACSPGHALSHLLDGEAQLGVVSAEVTDPGLEAQFFFRDSISLIVPGGHPWAGRDMVEASELIGQRMILREETSGTRRILLAELARFDISLEDLNVGLEIGSAEGIVELVAEGYGISFVSDLVCRYALQLGKIKRVRVQGVSLRRSNYLARKRIAPPNRPRDVFWGFVNAPENSDLLGPRPG